MAELMSRMAYARRRGTDPASLRYAIRRDWVIPEVGPPAAPLTDAELGAVLAAEIDAMPEVEPLSDAELKALLGEEP